MVNKYEMVATTLMGLEGVLADEIKQMGGEKVTELKRAVKFYGDDRLLYWANLSLRTALRILVPITSFKAGNEDELYREVKKFGWEEIFSISDTFIIHAITSSEVFKHSKYIALKTKDAIADRFRQLYGKRPSVDTENPDFYIHIQVVGDRVSISIDSSGISLDRRGYRKNTSEAPLNEVLAAGIILKSGYDSSQPFFDPMAGSGTFSIEAAMIATQTPPNLNRSFAFQNWNDYDPNLFEKVKFELKRKIEEPNSLKIFTRDIESRNIDIIAQNAAYAGVEDYINLKKEDFFQSNPNTASGIVFINPPYGERLKLSNIKAFYENLGDIFKQKYAGFEVWIISSDYEALKSIHLKPSFSMEMMNGGLKVKLNKYELYRGSRREPPV